MKQLSLLKSLLIIVCFNLLAAHTAFAQHCTWARQAGGTMDAAGIAAVTDASGNVYATGYYDSDTMHFGTSQIFNASSSSGYNMYLAKYDSSGNLLWVQSFGGINSDIVSAMAIDASGYIYLTGLLSSPSVAFGATVVANPNGRAIFLAKINGNGNIIWAEAAGAEAVSGINVCSVNGITTDASGNIFMTGYFQDSLTFGSTILTHTLLGNGIFIAKFDTEGNNTWAHTSNGAGDDESAGIALDASGNIYVTGSWTSTNITFDAVTLTNTANDNNAFFLVKYDPSGTAVWGQSTGDSNSVYGESLGTDAAGNIYVAGDYNSPTVTFGTTTLTNADPSGNTGDIFLVKYNASGDVIWAKSFGGNDEDDCFTMFVDAAGSQYLGGTFASTTITFGSTTLSNFGIFIAEANSSGGAMWAKGAANFSFGAAASIAKDPFGHLYVTGNYGSSTFSLDTSTLTDPSTPLSYTFVARYDDVSTGVPFVSAQSSISVYPNPAKTSLTISCDTKITSVTISDLLGQTVYNHYYPGEEQVQVDIAAMPAGVYFIKVNGTDSYRGAIRRFIKE